MDAEPNEQFTITYVPTAVDEAFTMTQGFATPPLLAGVEATVRDMVRVTIAFFVFIGAAVIALVFGSEAIRILVAVALIVGVWPLWGAVKRTLCEFTAHAIIQDAAEPPHES